MITAISKSILFGKLKSFLKVCQRSKRKENIFLNREKANIKPSDRAWAMSGPADRRSITLELESKTGFTSQNKSQAKKGKQPSSDSFHTQA